MRQKKKLSIVKLVSLTLMLTFVFWSNYSETIHDF